MGTTTISPILPVDIGLGLQALQYVQLYSFQVVPLADLESGDFLVFLLMFV